MARLAAKENLLFYPTGIPVVQLIAGNILPAGDEGGSILDPCCGQGEALALLGSALGLTTYGNELHPARAGQAKLRLDHCLNGPREFLVSGGLFNVVFNNPPYDFALSGQRMEFENIVQDMALLVNGGLGVWVIPRHTLTRELCGFLGDNLRQINVRKLPAPYYDRFKQVVVFGVKHLRSTSVGPSNYIGSVQLANLVAGDELPTLQAGEFSYRFYTADNRIDRFSLAFPEAARVLAEIETAGIQNEEGWQALFGAKDTTGKRFQPLLP
ncbi:MAG: hypothetical protein GY952_14805, partial [Rhodobacteraceae bacterium]|nr:hypothetical protein [Paracoccaceae bacterium]